MRQATAQPACSHEHRDEVDYVVEPLRGQTQRGVRRNGDVQYKFYTRSSKSNIDVQEIPWDKAHQNIAGLLRTQVCTNAIEGSCDVVAGHLVGDW
jgi:hypothetical protein